MQDFVHQQYVPRAALVVNVDEVDVAVVIVSAGVKFGVSASSVQGLGFRV